MDSSKTDLFRIKIMKKSNKNKKKGIKKNE